MCQEVLCDKKTRLLKDNLNDESRSERPASRICEPDRICQAFDNCELELRRLDSMNSKPGDRPSTNNQQDQITSISQILSIQLEFGILEFPIRQCYPKSSQNHHQQQSFFFLSPKRDKPSKNKQTRMTLKLVLWT
jgi:hypothetical protein